MLLIFIFNIYHCFIAMNSPVFLGFASPGQGQSFLLFFQRVSCSSLISVPHFSVGKASLGSLGASSQNFPWQLLRSLLAGKIPFGIFGKNGKCHWGRRETPRSWLNLNIFLLNAVWFCSNSTSPTGKNPRKIRMRRCRGIWLPLECRDSPTAEELNNAGSEDEEAFLEQPWKTCQEVFSSKNQLRGKLPR